jgi:hypothetical protein
MGAFGFSMRTRQPNLGSGPKFVGELHLLRQRGKIKLQILCASRGKPNRGSKANTLAVLCYNTSIHWLGA